VTKLTPGSSNLQIEAIEAIARQIEAGRRFLVAGHVNPDGDSLGTQLAFTAYLRDIGKTVMAVRDDAVPDKLRFLTGINDIATVDSFDDDVSLDTALLLECPVLDRIGKVRSLLKNGVTVVNIDHHHDNTEFGDVSWIDAHASSVGEMAFEYFTAVGYKISPVVAEHLYAAILTDTGRFRYANTTARTMEIAGQLINAGADTQKICDQIYYDLPPTTTMLVGRVLNGVEFFDHGRICLLTLTRRMLEETGAHPSETEGLVDYTMVNRGVVVGALLSEIDDKQTKISLRSKNGLNVAALAAVHGGGGHMNAAGCTLSLPLSKAKAEVLRLFKENGHE